MAGLDLRGLELVTLGACETALGRVDLSDNLTGLPSLLLAAGAQAVIGTLWEVYDEAATTFFTTLYDALARGGADVAQAFRTAQRETRNRFPEYRDWGAFYLTGGITTHSRRPCDHTGTARPDLLPVRLDPDPRRVLGRNDRQSPQEGRLSIGRPLLTALDTTVLDAQTAPFLRARPDSRFHLLTLTTSFHDNAEQPFRSAWVKVALRRADTQAAEQPVAWSMQPRTAQDEVSVSRKITLSPQLKPTTPVAGLDISTRVTGGRETTLKRNDVSLEALHEGTSTPSWNFESTDSRQIRGIHILCPRHRHRGDRNPAPPGSRWAPPSGPGG